MLQCVGWRGAVCTGRRPLAHAGQRGAATTIHFFGDKGNEALRETDRRVLQGGETIAREESNLILATGELRDATGQIIGLASSSLH